MKFTTTSTRVIELEIALKFLGIFNNGTFKLYSQSNFYFLNRVTSQIQQTTVQMHYVKFKFQYDDSGICNVSGV